MIYETPYDPVTVLCTGDSVPTVFDTLADVELLLGEPALRHPHCLTYPEAGVCYTDFHLHTVRVDTAVTVAAHCAHDSSE